MIVPGNDSAGGGIVPTVTWNVAVLRFACESVAWHVTVVVPVGNVEPEDGEQTRFGGLEMLPETVSNAVTV